MDGRGEGEAGEWELVHKDEQPLVVVVPEPNPNLAVIRPDYFSLNPHISNPNSSCSSNSSSEVDRNFDDSYVANQLFPNPISSSNYERWNDSDSDIDVTNTNTNTMVMDAASEEAEAKVEAEAEAVAEVVGFDSKEEEEEEGGGGVEKGEEKEEDRRVVWWKVPFEVLKYWVTPISLSFPLSLPLSVAAAATFLGLVILGRRLYKMKRKTQTLKLNLALDDKKTSQLMGRVARLNEAFSVVRRVPIVRPSLPAPTVTLRPVMSMR